MIAVSSADPELVSLLRGELAQLFSGTFFVLVGAMAFCIAAIRRRGGVRILVWLGIWSGIFGLNLLARSPDVVTALPSGLRGALPALLVALSYLMVVAGTLSFLELSRGALRTFLYVLISADVAVAVAGIAWYFITGVADRFILSNNLLAALTVTALVAVVAVPKLSRRFMAVAGHRVLTAGVVIFAAQALHSNLARPLNYLSPDLSSLGFAILLISFGYTAVQMIASNERSLVAINNELEIARQLQFSILPDGAPEIADLRIAAAYEPMTAVAGDFYEFLPIDKHHVGFLVADVSGHGVPAALIASMIKVATQSVNGCASDPAEVLQRLGSILSSHLKGQFVTAAYLWMDTEAKIARYSAAGHPPLLHWRAGDKELVRIASNGLLFGVCPVSTSPVCEFAFATGDRFLLYTDGVTEPENAGGEPFGDRKLEETVRNNRSATADFLSKRLLSEVRAWLPAAEKQQDDITLIVVDVL